MFKDYPEEPEEKITPWFYLTVAFAGLAVLIGILVGLIYFGVIAFPGSSSDAIKADPAKPRLSAKNRESAKAALNAIGEMNSVASVGANYMQLTSTIQSAKIKFDVAMREFDPQSPDDTEIRRDLAEAFMCYMDAKEAWGEFIEDGDRYGFLKPKSYSSIPKLATTYGFKADKGEHFVEREYFKDSVLGAILREGSNKFNSLTEKIK